MSVLERTIVKYENVRKSAQVWAKYGVFKALYLVIEASYHLFDTFPTNNKNKTFI